MLTIIVVLGVILCGAICAVCTMLAQKELDRSRRFWLAELHRARIDGARLAMLSARNGLQQSKPTKTGRHELHPSPFTF